MIEDFVVLVLNNMTWIKIEGSAGLWTGARLCGVCMLVLADGFLKVLQSKDEHMDTNTAGVRGRLQQPVTE